MAEDANNIDSPMSSDISPETTVIDHAESDDQASNASTKEIQGSADTEDNTSNPQDMSTLDDAAREEVISALQQEITTLRETIDIKARESDDFKAQYVRIAADFENYRKRTSKEKEEQELRIKCNTVNEILGAVDNFERARLQIKPETDAEMTIHKSYQGVYKQLVDGLKKIGVSAMRPEGEEFDPNFHEAIFQEPTSKYPEGTVIEQVVRGYLLGDLVLRHAMVKVAAAPNNSEQSDTNDVGAS